jgi:protein-S-isoprenylcysteine O-methyltransferase Ste14
MHTDPHQYIAWAWAAVGIVWLAAWFLSKPAARRQPAGSRLRHIAMMALAFALVFSPRLRIGPLAWRFVPGSPAIAWAGFALTAAGCAFTIWARLILGGNWSATVTIKQDHRLVRKGPYAIVRHPIYSGALLALAGTVLAFGEARGLAALALAFAAWLFKSRMEETFMTEQFGAAYTRYQREVKALIPFVL